MTRYQRAKRYAAWKGAFIALLVVIGWIGINAWSGQITAEQPITQHVRR